MTRPMTRMMLIAALFALGCSDAEVAPSAVIVEVTPETLDPALDDADDLTLRVEYADGDADLGGGVAAVHDCRADDLVVELAIPPLASDEALDEGVPIEGVLELIVNDVGWVEAGALPDACADLDAPSPGDGEAIFCVVLTDAAGNSGAGDCSGPIEITAP
jgi:hypothetical protein